MGVVLVDHGSRKAESNNLLVRLAELYKEQTQRRIVHHAHMELVRVRAVRSPQLGMDPRNSPDFARRLRPRLQTPSTRACLTAQPQWS